jgi:hypothetical protein
MIENGKAYMSRKWFLTLFLVALSTIGAFFPPIISAILEIEKPVIILSGTEWVSLVSMITAFYLSSNVFQKRDELKAKSFSVTASLEEKE